MSSPFKDRPCRIASYNIRKAHGLDGRRDPGRVLDVLNDLDADVIALQEADNRLGERPAALPRDMIDRHTDFDVVPTAVNDVSLGWHGNAVLVRRGTQVAVTSRITLPGLEPRGAVAVKLANELTVVGVHLGLLRSSRRRQLATIAARLGNMARAIVIGDMNEWAQTRGFEALAEDFTLHSPGRTFHAARPIAALDRVALTHDLTLHDAGVEEGVLAKRASDHLPIWADVGVNAPCKSVFSKEAETPV
ncbi:endonuclease/exonuclease/phosphatase family protein [Loktanella sp. Alg231-35]|uniref:endonuclease/exonuclease/phosphatase family protein n=1 Tax=Loktanella sp. Alg231-35 TaxID=1922220 RepID=UPI000D5521AC|nr:endonuclease/exonuclease/phosphatase family protein [Loktanella sp. Alg231-35]